MKYRKILVTLDGSKLAEAALEHVMEVARPGAQIHFLSVMAEDRVSEIAALASAIAQPVTTMAPPADQWPPVNSVADPRAVHARQRYLDEVSSWIAQTGYEVSTEVRPGNVVETIVSVAKDGFDLIVMVTHGRTGLSKVALGSVAEGVLHKAPCPVLIIPASALKAD